MRAAKKQRQLHRVLILLAAFLAWFATIEGRLVYLQVLQHDYLVQKALKQQQDLIKVSAGRGIIYDRKMHELAVSVDVQSVVANPQEVTDAPKLAATLSPLLDLDVGAIEEKLSSTKSYVYLKRKLSFEAGQRLQSTKLPGVVLIKESKRFFPQAQLAGQLLGFVGMDNQGLDGLELLYDRELEGTPGLYFMQKDAKQKILGSEVRRAPISGNTLILNLDKNIQFIVEQELAAAVDARSALGATAIVMNPHNGQILAMANCPAFDPNRFEKYPPGIFRNRAVTDVYEPGSTFKIVTFSSAFEEGQLDPVELINCQMGSITLANHTVNDHTPMGMMTYDQIIAHSSNVGAIKVGLRLGAERFYRRITAFGLGRRSGIDVPGEVPGLLRRPESWSGVSNGYIAMGYEVGVTPLQMLLVVSAVANGGYSVKPQVVQKVLSPEGELLRESPVERRQILTPRTVGLMRKALEEVVSEGTGKQASPASYRVAGKTGTAKKQDNGGYAAGKYVASFLGYGPVADPAFAAIVVIDEPKGGAYYGGDVAAPVFRGIADKILRYMEVPPDRQPPIEFLAKSRPKPQPSVPDEPLNLVPEESLPAPEVHAAGKPEVVIVSSEEGGPVVPDFRGKTLRVVMEQCSELGIDLNYAGTGLAVEQKPAAGTRLAPNTHCRVWFSRRPMRATAKNAVASRNSADRDAGKATNTAGRKTAELRSPINKPDVRND